MRAPPVVLIVAEQNDAHALMVAQLLRDQYGCTPTLFSMSRFPMHEKASFECGDAIDRILAKVGDLDLKTVKVVWWRRPTHSAVPNDYFVFDRDFLQLECDQFLQGLLWSTDCFWVNSPSNEVRASRKLCQLTEAWQAGLNIPRTLITNDLERAEEFISSVGKTLITKRIGTAPGTATRTCLLTPEDYRRLHTLQTCPTTLQEYIELGADIRVVVIGSECYAFLIDSAAGVDPVDSRLDLTVEHRSFELPANQQVAVRRVLDRLGLTFGVVDLRLSASGDYYFLEVNPSGQYAYLELLTGVPLSSHMARLLADCAHNSSRLGARITPGFADRAKIA